MQHVTQGVLRPLPQFIGSDTHCRWVRVCLPWTAPTNRVLLQRGADCRGDEYQRLAYVTETINHKLAALEGMLDLICVTSRDLEAAQHAFEEYAQPVRENALRKRPVDRQAAVEHQLAQLRSELMSMTW